MEILEDTSYIYKHIRRKLYSKLQYPASHDKFIYIAVSMHVLQAACSSLFYSLVNVWKNSVPAIHEIVSWD